MTVKPAQVKNHMWVFVNSLIENPAFDSQTKETLTLPAKNFGSKCELSEKFLKEAQKCGIVDHVLNWVQFKQNQQKDKIGGRKTAKLKVFFNIIFKIFIYF
jgi:DNA topoisomerase II